jgi:CBS domain containing-hemolysin-like protein
MSNGNLITLFFILVLLSGLFATIEIGLFSVPRARARRLAQEKGPVGDVFRRLLDAPHALLVQVLLANTFVGVGAWATAAVLLDRAVGRLGVPEWLMIAAQTVGLTAFFLVVCELAPKTVAFERNEAVAPWAARAYALLRPLLAPLAAVLERLAGWSTRLVRGREPEPLSADELETLVEVGAREGTLNPEESRLFRGAFRFGEKTAGEILVPRADVLMMEAEETIAAAIDVFAEVRHARIPIYEGTMEKIVGVLYAKDVIAWTLEPPGDRRVRSVLRPAFFAGPETGLEELLRAFQKERVHLAVIVDSRHRAEGIVTLEDVLEEIVGELADEFEEEEPAYRPLGDGRGLFRGRVTVAEVNRLLGVHLPGLPDETLARFIDRLRGPAPAEGDAFEVGGVRLVVEAVTGRQVWSVRVERVPAEQAT